MSVYSAGTHLSFCVYVCVCVGGGGGMKDSNRQMSVRAKIPPYKTSKD